MRSPSVHREAEFHGCSTLFFEHGVELVLGRIAVLAGAAGPGRPRGLDRARLERVFELIDAHLVTPRQWRACRRS